MLLRCLSCSWNACLSTTLTALMEMVNYLRYKDIHKSQSAGWWWGFHFPGNTPLLLAYTKGNGDLCRALVSQKFQWQHKRILTAAGEKRRHIGYNEQGQWKHLQLSSCDKTTPFQVIYQNLKHNTNIHIREMCKKKGKKLTDVSFMYVCVAGNGEMLVFCFLF